MAQKRGLEVEMRAIIVLVVVSSVLLAVSATAATSPSSGLRLCGQIKHGPHDAWTATLRGGKNRRLQGTTWTVTALLSPCSTGMKLARAVLPHWAKAKPDRPLKASGGWKCTKVGDIGPGSVRESRGVNCYTLAGAQVAVTMFGSLSIPQIKKEIGIA